MNKFTLKGFLFAVLVLMIKGTYYAQGFEVSPVKLNFAVEPGSGGSKTLTIRNHSNKRQSYSLSMGDWYRDSLGNKIMVEKSTKKFNRSSVDFITISPALLEIDPNGEGAVTITMQVPNGEYSSKWCMIYVKTASENTSFTADKGLGSGVILSPTIGVHVYQSPKSNTKYNAKLSSFQEITGPGDKKRKFSVMTKNYGDKIIDCKLYLMISNVETATEKKTAPVAFSVFPEGSMLTELNLPEGLAKGKYSVAAILDYGKNIPLEGIQINIEVK